MFYKIFLMLEHKEGKKLKACDEKFYFLFPWKMSLINHNVSHDGKINSKVIKIE